MNDYKIKNILESLKEEVENGKVSLREAAVELHKAAGRISSTSTPRGTY